MLKIGLLAGSTLSLLLLPACQDRQKPSATHESAAINAASPNAETASMSPPVQATSASDYLAKAGAGDLFEIESSKAVLDKTKDAKVRDFADMMVKAHEQSTAKLKAAASEAKLPVNPPTLTPNQKSMLDAIRSTPAARVDAVYVEHQKTAHDAALNLHRAYAEDGDMAPLKRAAGEIVPVVESHIRQLADLPSK